MRTSLQFQPSSPIDRLSREQLATVGLSYGSGKGQVQGDIPAGGGARSGKS